MTFFLKSLIVFSVLFPQLAQAKLFRNSYVSFELPPRWSCKSEGTEWLCRSQLKIASKEAIIILSAKERGPSDSLSQYQAYLRTTKTYPGKKGKPFTSIVKNTKILKVNNHDWVDSLHLGREIPSYYTRYLATIKNNVAILITFSAHKRYYTKYSADFFKAIQSLRAIAPKNAAANMNLRPGNETLGGNIGSSFPGDMILDDDEYPEELSEPSGNKNMLLLFGFLLLAVGAYFFITKKK